MEKNKDAARHNDTMKKPAVSIVAQGGDNPASVISTPTEKEHETKKKKQKLCEKNDTNQG